MHTRVGSFGRGKRRLRGKGPERTCSARARRLQCLCHGLRQLGGQLLLLRLLLGVRLQLWHLGQRRGGLRRRRSCGGRRRGLGENACGWARLSGSRGARQYLGTPATSYEDGSRRSMPFLKH